MGKFGLYVLIAFMGFSSLAQAETIRENFLSLRKIFTGQGRSVAEATVRVNSSEPATMLRRYLSRRHGGMPGDYRYFWNSDRLTVNDSSAGTIKPEFAAKVVDEWVLMKHHYGPEYQTESRQAARIVRDLLARGAVLAFDGRDVATCIFTTPLLLILDRREQTVYAVELNTCRP
ncbi:MAG TPA: hypothetical protein VFV50_02360 [Bdellovibrionales bacterium]|nr:hypothetical protein [Bdellovibrionales bacterium]